ncbi:MAG: hypothetical protein DRQ48_05980, partial [Gammaproteobacteria bacterium]
NIMARTVYQWTDETGNTNFSDVPPAESVATETHEFNVYQPASNNVDLQDNSIINQVEQMSKWRREIADERLAKRELYLEQKRLDQELEIMRQNEALAAESYDEPGGYYYAPYQYPQHRPYRRPYNRPEHRRYQRPGMIGGSPRHIRHKPIGTPSRRLFPPRRYGPVHL